MTDVDKELGHAVAGLRQQVKALASVTGVLLAALRQGGLMTPEFEALLSAGLVDAAAASSAEVRSDWAPVVSAVQKIAAATAQTTGGGGLG